MGTRLRWIAPDDSIVFSLNIDETLKSLLAQEDTDNDMQITIDDTGPKVYLSRPPS